MARQTLNKTKVQKLIKETGLDIEKVMVRGNTNHRKDLCLSDGTISRMYKDGVIENKGEKWHKQKLIINNLF